MSAMLEAALRYAALGWFIFPLHSIRFDRKCGCGKPECTSPGKHPRIKWKEGASCDLDAVRSYWTKWPNAGIGLATGPSGLIVFDLDGPKGVETFKALIESGIPLTARARTARGVHVFFRGQSPTFSNTKTKLDVRSVGGYVVLAPSPHVSGHVYRWEVEPDPSRASGGIADCPAPLLAYASAGGGKRRGGAPGIVGGIAAPRPAGQAGEDSFTTRLGASLEAPDWGEVDRALACIPADCSMDKWIKVGMALHAARDPLGWERWDRWSSRGGEKYKGAGEIAYKWTTFKGEGGVGIGMLFGFAKEYGYARQMHASVGNSVVPPLFAIHEAVRPELPPTASEKSAQSSDEGSPAEGGMNGHAPALPDSFREATSTNPLILLNEKHAVIADVGGKCLVLGWQNGLVDESVKVPSFQTFKSFAERYGNQYITVTKERIYKESTKEVEESVQLGAHWLKWTGRKTYEGIELAPNQPMVLPNGNYNLWRGWGVEPSRGKWSLMRGHIEGVLANRDQAAHDYILKFAAWSVQHPGERAEAALVLRGGKGTGKGVFLGALRRIFGAHGLQIFNRAHMVGNFNSHMRNCLFLFADEAYWAGDKQGESVLKGLITEPVLVLEQKGVDAVGWPNRLKVAMAANAAWVVPASDGERRYGVFNVSNEFAGDRDYFTALVGELAGGGLAAMLHDLLAMDLGDWHPRYVPQTDALQEQKGHSLPPLMEWWVGLLQGGADAWLDAENEKEWAAGVLFDKAREEVPALRLYSDFRIAKFIQDVGATKRHSKTGTKWTLPGASGARARFEDKFGKWKWDSLTEDWGKD